MKPTPDIISRIQPIVAGLTGIANGTSYRPSNGTEGELFRGHWCNQCSQDVPAENRLCHILTSALIGERPAEWMYWDNAPLCCAFQPQTAPLPDAT